jgi:hypothetical protein
MVLQILLRQTDFASFLLVVARRIILAIFVSAAMSSTMLIRTLDSPATSTKLFDYFAPAYWCWYSCRYWLTTLMAAHVHIALALRLKLKLWKNLLWYLQIYGLISILGCLQKSIYEDLKNLLVSFRLYFIIVKDSSYLYHILFGTINLCGIDCQKKKWHEKQIFCFDRNRS